jgi:hypothetical protein
MKEMDQSPFLVKQTKFWYILGSPKTNQLGNQVKHLLIILISILLLSSPVIGQSDEKCYVVVESSKDFDSSLLSNISISLISQFLREVEPIPPEGVSTDSCLYHISVTKKEDTTFVTFNGEGLNSYGDSKLSGSDGFQQSILKSLYRSLKDKRDVICQDYGELLEECGGLKDTSKKEVLVEEKRSQKSESSNYKLRGLIGSGSSGNTEFNNMSLFFVGRRLGIGLSDFFMKTTYSSGNKYEFNNRSLDFTYSFTDEYSYSFGMGVIIDGDAKSSTHNLKSDEVDGYRIMVLIGTNLGRWELLGGYQYSSFENKKFTTTKNLYISGGLMVFGVGVGL